MNALLIFALAATLGTAQVKEAPLQDPFPTPIVAEVQDEREYETVVFECTAYCPCSKCCGKWANGITASGATAMAGRTIAASKAYDFGTEIEIDEITYVVEDRGGAIMGNKIDIYFDTHAEALQFGRQVVEGKVYR